MNTYEIKYQSEEKNNSIDMLQSLASFEDRSEEELHHIMESLKELSLILCTLYTDAEKLKNES
jgi:hypothetical protein